MADKTEKFIEIVKSYPVLYDMTHIDYKNSRLKNKLWDSIAETMQEKDRDAVKAKWKNLRDSFSKHLRANKSTTRPTSKHIERYKYWPWVKQMTFLQPHLELALTHFNMVRDAQHYSDQPSTSQQRNTLPQEFVAIHNSPPPDPIQSTHSKRPSRKIIDKKNRIQRGYDDTDLIFLGYSKTIKKMSMRRQAKVKFKIARIIMEAEIEHADEISQSQSLTDRNNSPQEYYAVSPPEYDIDNSVDFDMEDVNIKEEQGEFGSVSAAESCLEPTMIVERSNLSPSSSILSNTEIDDDRKI